MTTRAGSPAVDYPLRDRGSRYRGDQRVGAASFRGVKGGQRTAPRRVDEHPGLARRAERLPVLVTVSGAGRWSMRILARAGHDVFAGETRVVAQDVAFRPALAEQADDEIHGQHGSADDGLSRQCRGVDRGARLPRHRLEALDRVADCPVAEGPPDRLGDAAGGEARMLSRSAAGRGMLSMGSVGIGMAILHVRRLASGWNCWPPPDEARPCRSRAAGAACRRSS